MTYFVLLSFTIMSRVLWSFRPISVHNLYPFKRDDW